MAVMSGMSGNEMYCLHMQGLSPGELVIGNSVYSMGLLGSLVSGAQLFCGGEVTQLTQLIQDGREQSYQRLLGEAKRHGGVGVTSVSSELRHFHGNIEFISVASCVHRERPGSESLQFTTSSDGQELYCQVDAGYTPKSFVFGNIAYSIGVGGGILGGLKSIARGEIKEFSDTFNRTRHTALTRLTRQARAVGANSVVGVQTVLMPFGGAHEMMMMGTASHNPALPPECTENPISSDLTCEEMWSVARMGYMPLKLVMGTAVYSLGVVGNITSALKALARGEISELTSLVYDAREHAIDLIRREADQIGADDVLGIKVHIHEIGNLLEFMAIGTAVKKHEGITTHHDQLPPQAIIRDKDTWISASYTLGGE